LDALELKLNEIQEKTEYLGDKTNQLVLENRSLKGKLDEARVQLQEKELLLEELKKQHEILQMARNLGEGTAAETNENTEELKKKINDYIREIDQCLKLIGD
jgi:chromosome segregation ATPase